MPWLKWQEGRQDSGYRKLPIVHFKRFDIWLLQFPVGSYIKPHVDSVESGRHFRLNIFLKNAMIGGRFQCSKCIKRNRLFAFFRPDKEEHSVTKVLSGTRYVLSIGFVLKDANTTTKDPIENLVAD